MKRRVQSLYLTLAAVAGLALSWPAVATVLPEERADIMYHNYDGGGITIDGPSLLVRKDIANKVSVKANYYVDNVSSASIDVEASGASRYEEKRTEYTLGADYLYEKALMSFGYTNSTENDYDATTYSFGISQDFFGDLTTLTLGYSMGNNTVKQTGNAGFEKQMDQQNYRFGISQIVTSNLLLTFNYEGITDEGYLNNPYRSYRYLNPANPTSYIMETEVYPQTHTSDAAAIGGKYYLPYRAAIGFNYRYFTDDWEIEAHTFELDYTHPVGDSWILDFSARHYQQTSAYFYSDLHQFQSADPKDFRARDKELSDYTTTSLGFGITYNFKIGEGKWVEKSSVTFNYNHIRFDYNNFTDLTKSTGVPGTEPLYSFNAEVIRMYLSAWY